MNETSYALSIAAYFLSEYDMRAVTYLGFSTRSEAIKQISFILGRDNNYLKLRRDEFDALPDSSSYRRGWANRPATRDVIDTAAYLKQFSFDQLSEIVNSLLENKNQTDVTNPSNVINIATLHEMEIEEFLNTTDPSASLQLKVSSQKVRTYNPQIIAKLKLLYRGYCQICGSMPFANYKTNICEAHHIQYFSKSENNDSSNIVILCPNHHRLIHALNPTFDYDKRCFVFPDNSVQPIILNYHL